MYKLKVKLYINTPLQQVVHLVQYFIHQRANLVCKTFNTLEHEHYGLSTNLQLHIDKGSFLYYVFESFNKKCAWF